MSEDKNIINKYNNGKIYTIRCREDNNLIYVGSTVQPLYKRWHQHKIKYNKENNKEYNKLLYIKMREIGIDCFYIELYENFKCDNIEKLLKREGEIIREIGNLNKRIEGRTSNEIKERMKEYNKEYLNNPEIKERVKEYSKEYCKEYFNKPEIKERAKEYNKKYHKEYYNKLEIKEQKKQYYNQNKEQINQRKKELYKLKKLQKQEQEQQPTGPESPQEIII